MGRNYARFYTLLKQLPAPDKDELKAQLVAEYTNGRTESLKETTDKEYRTMCEGMERLTGASKQRDIMREELRRKRSTVLHLLQKNGIDTTNWKRVDAYCSDKRIAGKVFRNLTIDELDALAIKLRLIMRKLNNNNINLN